MELKKDKSFPRGGKKPAFFKSSNNSTLSFLRKTKVKAKAKSSKKVKKSQKKNVAEKVIKPSQKGFTVKFVEDLKPSIIQEGMLLLGIVSKITEKVVMVSLPGGIRGIISIPNVSEFYSNIIEHSSDSSEIPSLMDILKVGDVLPVKVISTSEKHNCLVLTCDPKLINEKLSYNLLHNGLILTGSVKSQEDHGYLIDFGINHVNAFLNYEKVKKNNNLKIGQLLRCCIIKCNVSPGSCNVQLSILKKDINTAFVKNSKLSVFCFIPGFQFEVTVNKILTEGVEVRYAEGESFKGFIHEDHFLKKFSDPTDLEVGNKIIATLMYVKPLVNFLYFKIMPKKKLEWPFQFGDIVKGKVMKVRKSGVFFRISKGTDKAKCFVPLSKLKNSQNLQDKSDILHLYPLNKKVSKIRLQHLDFMGRYYVGVTDKASITEKYFSISDIKCGDIIPCKIVAFGKSVARLEIGLRIKGIVAFTDMTDIPLKNPAVKFKINQKVKARVLGIIPGKVLVKLTMKPTLLKEKQILLDYNKCKENTQYVGTVSKVMQSKIIVRFFNNIFGIIPKHLTPYPDAKSLIDNFHIGQVVKCFVHQKKEPNKLYLSLIDTNASSELVIGKKYEVFVLNKTDNGLFLEVVIDENTKCIGYIPSTLLTIHRNLASALNATYSPGEKFSAYCITKNIKGGPSFFAAEEVLKDFYEGKSESDLEKLFTRNSVLPFLFKAYNPTKKFISLQCLVPNQNFIVTVVKNDFSDPSQLFKHELIYGKILVIGKKMVEVSTAVRDVWDKDFHSSLQHLDSYLTTMTSLVLRQKTKLNAYSDNIFLGNVVEGVAEEVKTGHAIIRTGNGDLGITEGKFELGQNINGKIVWIDAPEQLFYVKSGSNFMPKDKKKSPGAKTNELCRGRVVFISQEVIIFELRSRRKGELAFLPRKRHLNDIESTECIFSLGDELQLWITKKNSNYWLAMDRKIVSLKEKAIWKKSEKNLKNSVKNLKRKLESEKKERLKKSKIETESDEIQVVDVKLNEKSEEGNGEDFPKLVEIKEEVVSDCEEYVGVNNGFPQLEYDDVEIKSEIDTQENDEEEKPPLAVPNDEKIELSSSSESEDEPNVEKIESSNAFGIGFNWEVMNNPSLLSGITLKKDESSSEDEDEDVQQDKKKKRRLTAIEKREKAKSEEERLRLIEERLMDTEREPENVDDFDRAVLANPNSSALWLKYMAFHIQGTEIEKARGVARRALKAISFREEQEKLNIWIALLNLENLYGSEDSFSKTLGEALQLNDPYKIHLHLLNLHGQNNKFQEMEKLGSFMLKKYKNVGNMWCDVATAYFTVGKIESARNVLQKGLTLVDKSQHVPLISKFAHLENKYGSPERAQTLYESILASFPKRVDIWSCYVDMLVKSNLIDLARQVLERAISQSLRPKKMKTLFKKFIAFEEEHGSPENVEKVREAAVEYVQTLGSFND